MAKEFSFKGKTVSELKALSEEEFAELVASGARRSLKRGVNKLINKKIDEYLKNPKQGKDVKPIQIHYRDAIITPKMLELTFGVHNGKEFVRVDVRPEMLGHRFGEFALTRKKLMHGKAGIGATKSSTAITARG